MIGICWKVGGRHVRKPTRVSFLIRATALTRNRRKAGKDGRFLSDGAQKVCLAVLGYILGHLEVPMGWHWAIRSHMVTTK